MLRSFFRILDAPAHETLRLERARWYATLLPFLSGAALVSASTLIAALLVGTPEQLPRALVSMARANVLRAVFEAIAVVYPSAIIFAAYLRLKIAPRAFIAALAVSLLLAGVVAVSTIPLFAFLALVSRAAPMIAPALLLPFITTGAIAATTARIVRALDPRLRARAFSIAAGFAFMAAFAVRALRLI